MSPSAEPTPDQHRPVSPALVGAITAALVLFMALGLGLLYWTNVRRRRRRALSTSAAAPPQSSLSSSPFSFQGAEHEPIPPPPCAFLGVLRSGHGRSRRSDDDDDEAAVRGADEMKEGRKERLKSVSSDSSGASTKVDDDGEDDDEDEDGFDDEGDEPDEKRRVGRKREMQTRASRQRS